MQKRRREGSVHIDRWALMEREIDRAHIEFLWICSL